MPATIDDSVVVQISNHASGSTTNDSSLFTFSSALKNSVFGSFAGMVSGVFEYPFDLAKVRLQAQNLSPISGTHLPRFNGPLDCLKQTWTEEGLRGLYRGLPVPIVGSMAETAALFVAYSGFQDIIRSMTSRSRSEKLTIPELGLAAAGAGFATSFVITPIELVKCKMQVQMMNMPRRFRPPFSSFTAALSSLPVFSSQKHISVFSKNGPSRRQPHSTTVIKLPPGPLGVVRETVRTHGFLGLWIGHTGTLVRETGGTAAWFVIKEIVADALLRHRKSDQYALSSSKVAPADTATELLPWESALSGAISGAVCVVTFYPADTVKSAMQTEDELRPTGSSTARAAISHRNLVTKASSQSFTGTLLRMYAAHGLKGLYTGCGMTVARAVPSSGIIFVVYDALAAWLG
ncbi:Amino-acid transporter arg-13 [Termitomyces sp. T112]|nr:Amino-acid transporter arg-13 [Termitomyces sp. T112]